MALAPDCFVFRRVWLAINEHHRPTTGGPERTATVVVNRDSCFDIRSVPDVEAVVGAAKDVNEEGICGSRCGHEQKPFDSRVRSLRAFDSP